MLSYLHLRHSKAAGKGFNRSPARSADPINRDIHEFEAATEMRAPGHDHQFGLRRLPPIMLQNQRILARNLQFGGDVDAITPPPQLA